MAKIVFFVSFGRLVMLVFILRLGSGWSYLLWGSCRKGRGFALVPSPMDIWFIQLQVLKRLSLWNSLRTYGKSRERPRGPVPNLALLFCLNAGLAVSIIAHKKSQSGSISSPTLFFCFKVIRAILSLCFSI